MITKKIKVPEEMLHAAWMEARRCEGYPHPEGSESEHLYKLAGRIVEAALRWMGEGKSASWVPKIEQVRALAETNDQKRGEYLIQVCIVQWIERMFLAPEPEIPDELKDLLYDRELTLPDGQDGSSHKVYLGRELQSDVNTKLLAAFLRGKAAK